MFFVFFCEAKQQNKDINHSAFIQLSHINKNLHLESVMTKTTNVTRETKDKSLLTTVNFSFTICINPCIYNVVPFAYKGNGIDRDEHAL